MQNTNNNADPEFQAIISSAKKTIMKINNGLAWLINFSVSNALFHSIFIALGVMIGYGLFLVSKPVYASSLSINNIRLKNDFCQELIGTISSLAEDKTNNSILAKKLNLSESIISQIVSVSYKPLNDKVERVYNDSLNYTVPFKIESKVFDTNILDSLELHLLNYLEQNEFVVKRKEIDKKAWGDLESKLDSELASLDSLERTIYKNALYKGQNSGSVNIIESEDLSRINEVSIHLYQRKLDAHKNIILNNSFEVISHFRDNMLFDGPHRNKLIFGFAFGAYLVSLFYLLYKRGKSKQAS